MENQKLNINVENGIKKLIIQYNDPEIVKEQTIVKLSGLVCSVFNYLEKRITKIDQKKCFIQVDRQNLSISLNVDEESFYGANIKGCLKINPDFVDFGINTNLERNTFQLADFIKMNRTHFESREVAMKLVTELRQFEAKVNKIIEVSDDKRANTRVLKAQVVETNIPEKLILNMSIFQGKPKARFEVEININPESLTCMLISPGAKEITEDIRDSAINEELERIVKLAPEIVIIEK